MSKLDIVSGSGSGGGSSGGGGGLPAITLNDYGQTLEVVIDPDNSTTKNVVPTQTITTSASSDVEINGSWEGVPISGSYVTSEGYEGVITWDGEEYEASGDLSALDNWVMISALDSDEHLVSIYGILNDDKTEIIKTTVTYPVDGTHTVSLNVIIPGVKWGLYESDSASEDIDPGLVG